jgi:hypothetical protein
MNMFIAGKVFKSKSSLLNYLKFVLNNQDTNQDLTGEWFDAVDGVLRLHNNYQEKVGAGEYNIFVQQCTVNPRNKNFMIRREDGSTTDFSFYKALTPSNKASEVKAALRHLVQDQCIDFKNDYFEKYATGRGQVLCAETGLKVTKKASHLDHYPLQFDEIVSRWFKLHKLKLSDIQLSPHYDNQRHPTITDEYLAQTFYDYHLEVANYRVVLAAVNLQRKRAKVKKLS